LARSTNQLSSSASSRSAPGQKMFNITQGICAGEIRLHVMAPTDIKSHKRSSLIPYLSKREMVDRGLVMTKTTYGSPGSRKPREPWATTTTLGI